MTVPRPTMTPLAVPSADAVCAEVELDPARRTVWCRGADLEVPDQPGIDAELGVWLYLHLHVGNAAAFGLDALRPDEAFEHEIAAALPPVRLPTSSSSPAGVSVTSDGLVRHDVDRVWVVDPSVPEADEILVPCARPSLSPGFFMFVHEPDVDPRAPLTRLYVAHDDPDVALRDWTDCVRRLVDAGLSFRSKLLSRRRAFPRNDAMVVYARDSVEPVLDVVGDPIVERTYAMSTGSGLCRSLTATVDAGAEPAGPLLRGQTSFGEHRCDALASAIVAVFDEGADLAERFADICRRSNIDPDDVSRNVR